MSNLAHSPVNDQRFKDALAETRELARTQADGERSLAKLAAKLVRWTAEGVISSDKNKHGQGVSDVSVIYDNWTEAHSKKAAEAHTVAGKKANKSKMAQVVKASENPNYDPQVEFDRLIDMRKAQAAVDAKSVRPEYHAIIEWARAQNANSDMALSDEQMAECIRKPEKGAPDVQDILEQVKNKLEKLISGEAGVKCQDQPVIDAHNLIREQLAALKLKDDQDEVRAKALELGWTVNEAGELEKAA